MFLTPLFAQAGALCRPREKSGRPGRAARKRPSARRASFERLEVREVLSPVISIPMPGVVLASVGATTADVANASFLDSSGRIVVAGETYSPTSGSDFAALRFQADGTLDSTFGNGGAVVTDLGGASYAYAAVKYPASPTDKIVLAGDAVGESTGRYWYYNYNVGLARYNGDGSLDSTFNYQSKKQFGTVVNDLGGREAVAGAVVEADGNIVVAGYSAVIENNQWVSRFTVARYTSVGKLDTAFGTGGVVTTSFGGTSDSAAAVTLHQGKILAVGSGHYDGNGCHDFALAQYNSNGTLDTTFGQDLDGDGVRDGKVVTDFGWDDVAAAVAIDVDDSILVLGNTATSLCKFGLARYLPDGTLDTSFGSGGLARYHFGIPGDGPVPYALAVEPGTRKIVAVGRAAEVTGSLALVVARFNSDGSLDSSFGTDGVVFTPVRTMATARSVAIQSSGKIVVSGDAYDSAANRHYILVAGYNTNGTLDTTFGVRAPSPPGITVTPTSGLVTTEAGGTASFSVVLNSQPAADVTIPVSSSDTSEGTVSVSSLIFTSVNWNIAQTVTVGGVDDTIRDGDIPYTIVLGPVVSDDSGYSGLDPSDVSVTNKDNEKGKLPGSALSPGALTDAALRKAAEADYATLAAAAMYEQTASRTSAVDQAFSDFSRTRGKNHGNNLALDLADIDFLLQR